MAPEVRSKKPKAAAAVPDVEAPKGKKVKQVASELQSKKRKASEDAAPSVVKKTKAPVEKKRVVSAPALTTPAVEKKSKSTKDVAAAEKPVESKVEADAPSKKSKKPKKSEAKEEAPVVEVEPEHNLASESDDESEEEDDQTMALLKGFESDDEEMRDLSSQDEDAQLKPHLETLQKKVKKNVKAAKASSDSDTPGVLYIGHIPHGFYEPQMKQYFKQFGDITNLRLSRNRTTGASKHFAFIEFKSAEVAEIVAKTMDNYLLFKHILKVKVLAPEQVHADLWKGANKRFKKVPWNKLESRKLEQGKERGDWEKKIEAEQQKRVAKAEKLKLMGYEFENPTLKAVKDVPKRKQESLIVTADAPEPVEEVKAIEAAAPVAEPKKKGKKTKSKASEETTVPVATPVEDVIEAVKPIAKKAEKAVAAAVKPVVKKVKETLAAATADEPAEAEKPKKAKKAKKAKAAAV